MKTPKPFYHIPEAIVEDVEDKINLDLPSDASPERLTEARLQVILAHLLADPSAEVSAKKLLEAADGVVRSKPESGMNEYVHERIDNWFKRTVVDSIEHERINLIQNIHLKLPDLDTEALRNLEIELLGTSGV